MASISEIKPRLGRQDWLRVLREHGHHCHYCGDITDNLIQEHKTPRARGGLTTIENIVPACPRCNSRKRDRDEWEFRQYLRHKEWSEGNWREAQEHVTYLATKLLAGIDVLTEDIEFLGPERMEGMMGVFVALGYKPQMREDADGNKIAFMKPPDGA